jgi:uncharacterized membrane protein
MNKEQLLEELKQKMQTGEISEMDVNNISRENIINLPNESPSHHTSLSDSTENKTSHLVKVFYGIGALIVAIGIVILIAQNWNEIGFAGKVIVTLGIGVVCYITGFLARGESQTYLSQIMFTLSAFLMLFGVIVSLNDFEIMVTTWMQFWIAVSFVALFGFALYDTKRSILILIITAFASWAYYSLFFQIFGNRIDANWTKYATIILGVSYLLIAYDYKKTELNNVIKNVLYGIGILMILMSVSALGGIFDIFQIVLIFSALYLSVFIKSRVILAISALFLIVHIIKLTSEYFVDSIGWPLALIIMGFATIGIGYATVYLNNKFITSLN